MYEFGDHLQFKIDHMTAFKLKKIFNVWKKIKTIRNKLIKKLIKRKNIENQKDCRISFLEWRLNVRH